MRYLQYIKYLPIITYLFVQTEKSSSRDIFSPPDEVTCAQVANQQAVELQQWQLKGIIRQQNQRNIALFMDEKNHWLQISVKQNTKLKSFWLLMINTDEQITFHSICPTAEIKTITKQMSKK